MKSYQIQSYYFKVLTHPTRLAILEMLRDGEQCVCHMEAVFGLRQAHISQHLMILRDAGLVTDRREGWNIFYRIARPEIFSVIDAMKTFSGVQGAHTHTEQPEKKIICPCPKCNVTTSSSKAEAEILPPYVMET